MVLVEYDQIPFGQMHPFIARLDATGALISAHEVLEATEANDRSILVRVFELQAFAMLTARKLSGCVALLMNFVLRGWRFETGPTMKKSAIKTSR